MLLALLFLLLPSVAWGSNVPTCAQTPNSLCATAPAAHSVKVYESGAWVDRALNNGDLPVSGSEVYVANTFVECDSSTVSDTCLTDEDFGDFTCTGQEDGCTINGGTQCLSFVAEDIACSTTGGCGLGVGDGTYFSWKWATFGTDADDIGTVRFVVPKNITGTDATVKIFWYSASANCDNGADDDVCWTVDSDSFGAGDAWATGTLDGTEVGTSSRCVAQNQMQVTSPMTLVHSLEAGELAVLQLRRDTDETIGTCSDDLNGNAFIVGVEFCYSTDDVYTGE